MTKRQEQEQDELILAAIIAGAMTSGRSCRRGKWGFDPNGPACAVSMGVIYTGMRLSITDDPRKQFAVVHNVTHLYASGVSDGFEGRIRGIVSATGDYERGTDVGTAAAEALLT